MGCLNQRLRLCLSSHQRGKNVWEDLLDRWSLPPTVRRLLAIAPLKSSADEDFFWLTSEELACVQSRAMPTSPKRLEFCNGLWQNSSGAIWIPSGEESLQLPLCIIAHTYASGHCGRGTTESVLKQHFYRIRYLWTFQHSLILAYIGWKQQGFFAFHVRLAWLFTAVRQTIFCRLIVKNCVSGIRARSTS